MIPGFLLNCVPEDDENTEAGTTPELAAKEGNTRKSTGGFGAGWQNCAALMPVIASARYVEHCDRVGC